MIIAFKSALKSVLANPWAAIGIGAAMVAAAAIMTALINKNAQESVPAPPWLREVWRMEKHSPSLAITPTS